MRKMIACMLGAAALCFSMGRSGNARFRCGESFVSLQEDGLEPRLGVPAGRRAR